MAFDFDGKAVLITGGSRGIGRAIAVAFGAAGARVGIVATNQQNAEAAARAVRETGAEAEFFLADVSDSDRAGEVVKQFIERFGQLDCLVNNAGITRDNLLLRMKDEDWQRVLDVNLTGTFVWCRAVARPMLKKKSGVIVNVSSVVGLTGNAGQVNYAASKAGVLALTRSVARELGSRGIRVNAVCPGFVETDMTAVLDDETRGSLAKSIALARFGRSEEVAGAVLFLASDQSSYITGSVLVVDGGMTMA